MNERPRPILTDEEVAALLSLSTTSQNELKRAWFWLSLRSYYLFAVMGFVAIIYYWHRDSLLLIHFADDQYRNFLNDQYLTQRFYTATATTLLYAYGFFTRHAFRMITFAVAFLASFNLLSDLFYIYDRINFPLSMIPCFLLANRFISIIFLWMNFYVLQKMHRHNIRP